MKRKQSLNFDWGFSLNDVGLESIDSISFETVQIPHNLYDFPLHYFNEKTWPKKAWYRKLIKTQMIDCTQRVQLMFEGIMVQADLYINRQFVGHSRNPYLPWIVDIHEYLSSEDFQEILVYVNAEEDPSIPPFGHVVDYLTYGGIYREVYLIQTHEHAFKRLKITTHDADHVSVSAEFFTPVPQTLKIKIELMEENHLFSSFEALISDQNTWTIQHEPQSLWSVETPKLYIIRASLYDQSECLDVVQERYGYRHAKFESDGFYLNGQRVQLMGLNRHQSYPYVGYAMPQRAQALDAELLKNELGVNFVRTSHYPQSRHFLDRCDELGLLVFEEIPGWQHIGDTPWKELSISAVEDMIHRDYNHPSIILWGVRINESKDDHAFYQKTNEVVHLLDPYRQTAGVRNFANSELLEDVYTYNDFNYMGDNRPLSPKQKIVKAKVPYLITEYLGHMFPTKKTDSEDRRIEHTKRHLDVLNQAFGDKNISGSIAWCMADYSTHADFGSGDRVCYHGVMDIFRLPKLAASAYASQGLSQPYCVWGSSMEIGDRNASLLNQIPVYTNCDYIELFKGQTFIKRFYPDTKSYPHLKHPPIIIDDLIGTQLMESSLFSKKDAFRITRIFNRINTVGFAKLSLFDQAKVAFILVKNKMTFSYASDLYTQVVGNWGQSAQAFHLKGYQNDQCVIERTKGASTQYFLKLTLQDDTMIEEDSYDALRCVVHLENQYEQLLPYADFPLEVSLTGPIEIIGPHVITLTGGSTAFWIKSTQESGLASVQISHPHFGQVLKKLTVIKK